MVSDLRRTQNPVRPILHNDGSAAAADVGAGNEEEEHDEVEEQVEYGERVAKVRRAPKEPKLLSIGPLPVAPCNR